MGSHDDGTESSISIIWTSDGFQCVGCQSWFDVIFAINAYQVWYSNILIAIPIVLMTFTYVVLWVYDIYQDSYENPIDKSINDILSWLRVLENIDMVALPLRICRAILRELKVN